MVIEREREIDWDLILVHLCPYVFIIETVLEIMKLDLINSRLETKFGHRVYDSLEDADIYKPEKISNSFTDISFKSKEPKILYSKRNSFVPNIFDKAVIDSRGNYLDTSMRIHPKIVNPNVTFSEPESVPITTSSKLFTPTLDRIKDKIHDSYQFNLANRVASKKLPGATWAVASRDQKIPESNTGPGYYEVYQSQLADTNIRLDVGPSDRGGSTEFVPSVPIKTRRRLEKIEKAQLDAKSSSNISKTIERPKTADTKSILFPHHSNDPAGSFKISDAVRFEALIYKQEPYLKTSGMILPPDFDKIFDKKIKFSMQNQLYAPQKSTSSSGSLTGNVDVDVGSFYSIVNTAKRSPVKYAAAFKYDASLVVLVVVAALVLYYSVVGYADSV